MGKRKRESAAATKDANKSIAFAQNLTIVLLHLVK